MNSQQRRNCVLEKLQKTEEPIKGNHLAKELKVSRQVIVQDIALLRAQGQNIMATPLGYIIPKENILKLRKTLVSQHRTYDEMKEELQIMIDYGAKVLDVVVEHPVYGELKGILDISHKQDLEGFMNGINEHNAEPLSTLTEGVHIHTIEIDNEENFEKMKLALYKKGYLIRD
ncbi:transcription repressor NadR [Serpentinicella sp. ANB-PHB4]|uniref:transcription repressor NadR n=1 Tax=Serpentinicella sp. ANB-PHB4 TaxID=3074076 RepID=UPI00286732A1|nr:transcription repressor NadR [Serpentinicella sp. ANB-PHB4]MDR5659104.1 transcription repressor NadR [Serpentinicella sp. ANB-PHB4]